MLNATTGNCFPFHTVYWEVLHLKPIGNVKQISSSEDKETTPGVTNLKFRGERNYDLMVVNEAVLLFISIQIKSTRLRLV